MTAVVAESADNLGKYGLAAPAITFTATEDSGKSVTLARRARKREAITTRRILRGP